MKRTYLIIGLILLGIVIFMSRSESYTTRVAMNIPPINDYKDALSSITTDTHIASRVYQSGYTLREVNHIVSRINNSSGEERAHFIDLLQQLPDLRAKYSLNKLVNSPSPYTVQSVYLPAFAN